MSIARATNAPSSRDSIGEGVLIRGHGNSTYPESLTNLAEQRRRETRQRISTGLSRRIRRYFGNRGVLRTTIRDTEQQERGEATQGNRSEAPVEIISRPTDREFIRRALAALVAQDNREETDRDNSNWEYDEEDREQESRSTRQPVSHAAIAAEMPRAEREFLIRELQEKDNKNPAPAMSRACRVCFTDSPHQRAVFTACGHVVCRACAFKVAGEAADEGRNLTCPFCRAETDFVPLFEDPVEAIQ